MNYKALSVYSSILFDFKRSIVHVRVSKRSKQAVSEVKLEKAIVYLLLALRKLQFQLASFRFLALSLQFLALEITSTTQRVSKMPSVSSLDITSVKVVICIQTSEPMKIIVPEQLFLLNLSEKTSLGGELAGGEVVSWRRVGWWRDSLVAR